MGPPTRIWQVSTGRIPLYRLPRAARQRQLAVSAWSSSLIGVVFWEPFALAAANGACTWGMSLISWAPTVPGAWEVHFRQVGRIGLSLNGHPRKRCASKLMSAKMLVEERSGLARVKFVPRSSIWLWLVLVFFILPWGVAALVALASAVIGTGANVALNPSEVGFSFLAFVLVATFVGRFVALIAFELLGSEEISFTATEFTVVTRMLGLQRKREFLLIEISQLSVEERFHPGKIQGRTNRKLHFLHRGKSVRLWSDISSEDSISLSGFLSRRAPPSVLKVRS